MTLPDILGSRHSVGPALFLWEYLLCNNTKLIDAPWMPVADGIWISDEQLAYRLDVTAPTIKRWRRRLEQLGYLRTELVRRRYRKFWLANAYASSQEQSLLTAPVAGPVN